MDGNGQATAVLLAIFLPWLAGGKTTGYLSERGRLIN